MQSADFGARCVQSAGLRRARPAPPSQPPPTPKGRLAHPRRRRLMSDTWMRNWRTRPTPTKRCALHVRERSGPSPTTTARAARLRQRAAWVRELEDAKSGGRAMHGDQFADCAVQVAISPHRPHPQRDRPGSPQGRDGEAVTRIKVTRARLRYGSTCRARGGSASACPAAPVTAKRTWSCTWTIERRRRYSGGGEADRGR